MSDNETSTGNPVGRPGHEVTDESKRTISNLFLAGVPIKDIARYMRMTERTLMSKYKQDLEDFKMERDNMAMGKLWYHIHEDNSFPALKFYMATQMGWKETSKLQHEGKDGGPIKIEVTRTIVDPNDADD